VKDLLSLKKASMKMLVIMGLYIVIFSMTDSLVFVSSMIILVATLMIMNTFAFDELSKWDYYALSLPVTKKQIVLSKYLLTFFFDVIGIIISLVLNIVKQKLNTDSIVSICVLSALALIMASIMLPLIYKLGTQKARIWIILIFLIPAAGLALIGTMGIDPLAAIATIGDSVVELLVYLSLPVAILIFIGSFFLSCHIFKNKEI